MAPPGAQRMQYFLSRHDHSLDSKGRLTLPAEFRSAFGEVAILSPLLDGCVAIWSQEEFDKRAEQMLDKARRGQAERNVARSFAANAKEVSIDSHGRIVVPAHLRTYADLGSDVAVVGALNHVELWNPDRWSEVDGQGSGDMQDASLEIVADMGF